LWVKIKEAQVNQYVLTGIIGLICLLIITKRINDLTICKKYITLCNVNITYEKFLTGSKMRRLL